MNTGDTPQSTNASRDGDVGKANPRDPGRKLYPGFKRALDFLLALALLPLAALPVGAAALFILLESGRPVFFVQQRPGLHGKLFRLYKLRTMISQTHRDGQPLGDAQRLTRAVGKYKAMDLILTGRMMDAEEAERAGLVSRILPAEGFFDEVQKVAEKVAGMSHVATAAATAMVDEAYQTTLTDGVEAERQQFWKLFDTEDQTEGMTAFVEKRKPEWKNR